MMVLRFRDFFVLEIFLDRDNLANITAGHYPNKLLFQIDWEYFRAGILSPFLYNNTNNQATQA